jgi:catechol 2,3-dioxygenase-like lactoylglutathione lyase family enzyme
MDPLQPGLVTYIDFEGINGYIWSMYKEIWSMYKEMDAPMPALPGLRGGDHIGFTVPNLDEAGRFLTEVLGAVEIYRLPEMKHPDEWMLDHLNVDPRAVVREIRFYRLGYGLNFEVFEYAETLEQQAQPQNSDIGGHHVALYVDDIEAAVAYLRAHEVHVLGEPTTSGNASLGQRWVYFLSPWGMQFELVSYPNGKAYEDDADVVLWNPRKPAE